MAVVYPCEDDQNALVTFARFFVEQEAPQALFPTSTQDVEILSNACQSVLRNLDRVVQLLLASTPLHADEVPQAQVVASTSGNLAYEAGSVYPHLGTFNALTAHGVVLSESAGAAPLLLQNPKSFLRPQLDALNVMVAELDSAADTLRAINAKYAYLWTTNVEALRQYVAQDEKRQRAQKPMWERADMRPLAPSEPTATDGAPEQPTTTAHPAAKADADPAAVSSEKLRGDSAAEPVAPPTYRSLLALDAAQLPSEQVRRSFAKFIQACASVQEWAGSVSDLLEGRDDVPRAGTYEVPPNSDGAQRRHSATTPSGAQPATGDAAAAPRRPATKTVRIHRYEIRDVSHIYDMYYQQAECFFLPEYAVFDPRIHQRLVQPAYFYALRMLLEDMSEEMERLRHIAGSRNSVVRADTRLSPYDAFAHGAFMGGLPEAYGVGVAGTPAPSRQWSMGDEGDQPKIVFRPTVSQFAFLRNTLRLLLSICLNESDRTSFKQFEEMYQRLVASAKESVAELHHLPKPPSPTQAPEAGGERRGPVMAVPVAREIVLVSRESMTREAVPANKRAWVISAEERGRLRGGFEAYWDLRDNLHTLKSALDKDIRRKDETHRTRVLGACVAQEQDRVAIMALERERERRAAVLRERRESGGLLGTARASWRALAGIATCKAEVQMEDLGIPSTPQCDDDGVEVTNTSPYHAEKVLLQTNVNRLWNAVEAHGAHMEREYPGVFYRGEKQRWTKKLGSIVGKANAVSVVFSP